MRSANVIATALIVPTWVGLPVAAGARAVRRGNDDPERSRITVPGP